MIPPEKTLEINFVRNYRYSSHLVWQGATLRQEFHVGWDVKIENLTKGKSFILQFKKPHRVTSLNGKEIFEFRINNNSKHNQNAVLANLATGFPNAVFYAFPCVNDMAQLNKSRTAILNRTALADISQKSLVSLRDDSVHRIEIDASKGRFEKTARLYSDQDFVDLLTVTELKHSEFDLEHFKDFVNKIDLPSFGEQGSTSLRVKMLTEVG